MDKFEYKVRAEEIKSLIAEGAYAEAAEIADTIDWRRVKSVMMLCTVSDLYKVNRRYEDAKNMLLLAYDKKPGGRTICYSLCELCIKTEEFVQAVNYYNEFTRVAPKDPERYILQYRLYEAQNVNLEERIGVLEELKKRDYREKWAYELAYLYHRVGLATRCVEECDELILWFGEGKYVIKAMELKMLHQPLTYEQQEAYDHRFDEYVEEAGEQYTEESEVQDYDGQEDYGVQEENGLPCQGDGSVVQEAVWEQQDVDAEPVPEETDIQVKTMDVGRYNTINLQEELAAGLQEVLGAEETGNYGGGGGEPVSEDDEMEGTEIFFGETGEIEEAALAAVGKGAFFEDEKQADPAQEAVFRDGKQADAVQEAAFSNEEQEDRADVLEQDSESATVTAQPSGSTDGAAAAPEDTSAAVMKQIRKETMEEQEQPPRELADVLLQETDGQISMVLPERTAVERQITGQMKIEDILAEWERMKKENEEKCKEEVRQHVLRQTGPMFTEFEAAVRDGLLEQLEGTAQEHPAVLHGKETAGTAAVTAGVKAADELMKPEGSGRNQGLMQHAGTADYGQSGEGRKSDDSAEVPEYAEEAAAQTEPAAAEKPEYREEAGKEAGLPEQDEPDYREASEWDKEQNGSNYVEDSDYGEGEAVLRYEEVPAWAEDRGEVEYTEANGSAPEFWGGFGGEEAPEWETGQEDPDREYEETPEWEAGQEDPDREYEETLEWEAGQEDPDREYEETPEWEVGQENPDREYEEGLEWEGGQEDPDREYEETPGWEAGQEDSDREYEEGLEWEAGQEDLNDEYGEAPGWDDGEDEPDYVQEVGYGEDGETPEEAGWSQNAEDGAEIPEYGKEAETGKRADRLTDYAEDAEYIEDGGEVNDQSGPAYAEAPEVEKSEALDYLEALEHVEEEADEDEAALGPDGFETIGPEKEEAREDNTAGKEKKTGSVKENGGQQKDIRPIPEREKAKVRSLTREEKELFAPFIQNRQSREQLVKALDGISMAAYTGNVVITGEEGMDTLTLAKNMIREVRMTDSNFSGKVAKITGAGLNRKNVREILEGLHNGALIIQKASGMDSRTAGMLHISLQQEKFGIIVIMEDTKKAIQKLFLGTPQLFGDFTSRVDLEALSNDTLVSFGRRYAREKEYSIDDLGMLALHTRIEESQTIDHVVTVIEVKQIVDEAIRHANRKTIGHFFDILLARRYDDEDMIILTEKDFVA